MCWLERRLCRGARRHARGLVVRVDAELYRLGHAFTCVSTHDANTRRRRKQIFVCNTVCRIRTSPIYLAHCFLSPGPEIGVLLSTYDFANANKVFCFNLVSTEAAEKGDTSPMSAFLSLTSYSLQHAHRSQRAALYTYLHLFILQLLVEDQSLVKRLCSEENKLSVRLCRQRQPYLPLVKGERTAAAVIIDLVVDGINHNLRRRLDIEFYTYVP